jgi:hypothetical protein
MSVNLDKKTCDTIGCRAAATHILSTPGLDSEEENVYIDHVCEPCGQGYLRRPALRATLAPMAQTEPPAPQSGYTPCACRDCMDTAITSDGKPSLCLLCKDAGCEISYGEFMGAGGAHSLECQRDDAYGE